MRWRRWNTRSRRRLRRLNTRWKRYLIIRRKRRGSHTRKSIMSQSKKIMGSTRNWRSLNTMSKKKSRKQKKPSRKNSKAVIILTTNPSIRKPPPTLRLRTVPNPRVVTIRIRPQRRHILRQRKPRITNMAAPETINSNPTIIDDLCIFDFPLLLQFYKLRLIFHFLHFYNNLNI